MDQSLGAEHRPFNVLLSYLPEPEYERLAPDLELVSVARGDVICQPGGFIDFVYFPLTSVAAITVLLAGGARPAVATIGHEGLIGIPILLGDERSPHHVTWCVSGNALRIRSMDLRAATTPFSQLARVLAAYAEMRMTLVAQNVACTGLHEIQARCARWLLSLSDDAETDLLDITHESLALMLGASRQSVSLALGRLNVDGLIAYHAGHMVILSRSGLEGVACECYESIKSESRRVFGSLVA